MQEDAGGEKTAGHIAPVDHLVEIIQFAREVKSRKYERGQAQNVEMQRPLGTTSPEVDEQANPQVSQADQILIVEGRIAGLLANAHIGAERDAGTLQRILDRAPRTSAHQHTRDIQGIQNRCPADLLQDIAGLDTRLFGRASVDHVQGFDAPVPVHPGYAVFGQAELALLLKIDARGDDRRHSQDDEQSPGELTPELPHWPPPPIIRHFSSRSETTARWVPASPDTVPSIGYRKLEAIPETLGPANLDFGRNTLRGSVAPTSQHALEPQSSPLALPLS